MVALSRFLRNLQYTSCTEDLTSELSGLDPKRGETVITVAGGGGRAIGLLLSDAARVIAIDANSLQVAITRLKAIAIGCLEYEEFLTFLGVCEGGANKRETWSRVLAEVQQKDPQLAAVARRWQSQRALLYAGKVEKHFAAYAAGLRFLIGPRIRALFSQTDLEQQRALWSSIQSQSSWRRLAKLGTSPWVFRLFLDNWGWFRRTPSSRSVPDLVLAKLEQFLQQHLARDSHLLQLIFLGNYQDGMSWPHYLRRECYAIIKSRIDRLTCQEAELSQYLQSWRSDAIVKLSVSNVPAYMTDDQLACFWRACSRNLAPQSRIMIRGFLAPIIPDENWLKAFRSISVAEMTIADTSFVYDLCLAEKVAA